ncbi:MAG TPA: hypothetical protein DCQ50_07960 [Chryseobacterium sp.]|nr:hypothetical protein [Chryseobacterium sp.]
MKIITYILNSKKNGEDNPFEEWVRTQPFYTSASVIFMDSVDLFLKAYNEESYGFCFRLFIHPKLRGNSSITNDNLLDVITIHNSFRNNLGFESINIPLISRSTNVQALIASSSDNRANYINHLNYLFFDATKNGTQKFLDDIPIFQKTKNGVITINNQEASKSSDLEFEQNNKVMKKLFISHSNKDHNKIKLFIDLLEDIGLTTDNYFYSSDPVTGVEQGENIFETLKNRLNNDDFAIFMLSKNFYKSEVCLCEMGAVWIKSSKQIPILIPPFDFKDVKGVFPNTLGFKMDNKEELNKFKETLEKYFSLKPLHSSRWEEKRNEYLDKVKTLLKI